jgi:alkylation response protein AidB-like acyl-CoA dehydrogenase
VRTDATAKKQQGISFLLIDLQSRGVSSRPISLISGSSPFCEVFMDEVRVPARNLVGKLNEGWTIAKALLGFERTMIGDAIGGQMAQAESLLLASAREQYGVAEGEPLDALSRDAIARIAMDERAFGLVREHIRQTAESGKTPGPESSITKAYGADLKQRRYELAMRLLGPEAVGWEGAPFDQTGLDTGREWLRARANSIEGGSSEIQLNVIAQHVLGLPK